jgi:glycosyltransferase involved in cell wall biosynthesis
VECELAEANVRPDWDVVWLSDIPWTSLWQRPQQLATRFPDRARILFVEPWTLGHGFVSRPSPVTERVARVSFPFLPLHARSLGQRRAAYRLGSVGPAMSVLHAAQRAWIGTLHGFFRPGARRLALVENFMGFPTLDAWHPDRVVYDMIDAPLHFAPVPPALTPYWEALLARADRVVVTSGTLGSLARKGGARNPTLVGNGVEMARFADAERAPAPLPGDPSAPAVGYVGSLHSWFDVPLVAALARAFPDARVVLVGPAHPDTERLIAREARTAPNLHWLGARPYADIPRILGAFQVGLIPFLRTPLTEAVNPVKLYEYAAAGIPTVTTRFSDEVDDWREVARVADDADSFVEETRRLLAASPDRASLRRFAARHDWNEIARRFTAVALEDAA